MNAIWQKSLRLQTPLLAVACVYSLGVVAEAVYYDVPWQEMQIFFRYMLLFVVALAFFAFGLAAGTYIAHVMKTGYWTASLKTRQSLAAIFSSGYTAYAVPAALVLAGNSLFLIAKSLIGVVNPFPRMKWDFYFSDLDKTLHGGRYPFEAVVPFVNMLHMGRFLDASYFLWLNVTLFFTVFNLFFDTRIHRRLRYIYVSLLSWILLGSVAATIFSTAGPMFYHRIYQAAPDIYGPIAKNLSDLRNGDILFTTVTRALLWKWQTNETKLDPNAISAMPSMHVAIAWLTVLYARSIGNFVTALAALFFGIIFAGSIYFGFHYAIDGYVSVAAVSLLWWLCGKVLDRYVTRDEDISGAGA